MPQTLNSIILSRQIFATSPSEDRPTAEDSSGLYLGRTLKYNLPIMFNLDSMVNPHISIIGISGSGKTNFMKNLALKFKILEDMRIIMLDWSGEYYNFAVNMQMDCFTFEDAMQPANYSISGSFCSSSHYFNMSKIKAAERSYSSGMLLSKIEEAIFSSLNGNQRISIFIDEVWHFLKDIKARNFISKVYREGRKFGLNMVVATQLYGDLSGDLISNSGTIFIFKLTGNENINGLLRSGLISEPEIPKLLNFEVGMCFCIFSKKDSRISKFILKKSQVFQLDNYSIRCSRMELKINVKKFLDMSKKFLAGKDAASKLSFFIESRGGHEIELHSLIGFLLEEGEKRPFIISFCRSLGIGDIDIIAAYAKACSALGEKINEI